MKKSIIDTLRAAGLGLAAVAMAGLTACTNEDNATTQPAPQAAPVYQVSIPAGFDEGAATRAVSLNGAGGLDATFEITDDINVYNKTKDVIAQDNGYNAKLLHPDADGATAKLVGELTFYDYFTGYKTVDVGDVLVLANNAEACIYYNCDYRYSAEQSGTLACLNWFDFASCEVSITGISGAGTVAEPYTLTTSKADFVNAQSMFKFTFTGLPTGVGVKTVKIHSAGDKLIEKYVPSDNTNMPGDVTINFESDIVDGYGSGIGGADGRREANGEGVVYAALRFEALGSGETDDITFTVEGTDGKTYTATKTSPAGGFLNGKYYTSTIALHPVISLAARTSYTAADGDVLTGKLGGADAENTGNVKIAAGATVVLDGVDITAVEDDNYNQMAGIECQGDAIIILSGTNTVKPGSFYKPAILVPSGCTLTIRGSGKLTADATGHMGAGIGGGDHDNGGSVVIESGTIEAKSDAYSAGIGGGNDHSFGTITISGGSVTATASAGAGIGSGNKGSCGAITISGGSVTAKGVDGAGIGSGDTGSCNGGVNISGGTVTANGINGAGIGSGGSGSCNGGVTITNGVTSVTASTKGNDCVGRGDSGTCGAVVIGGVTYWNGSYYTDDDSETYLQTSPLVYPQP